jgi:SAM-dependent methyltransferase
MTAQAASFVGTIPAHYDQELGPVIFEHYAADMARRVVSVKPMHVLELAAGTGIVTRALRNALPKRAQLTATDLNPPMLDVARTKFKPRENVTFEQADAMALPFKDAAFDAVACQFGVMFFPDKDKSYHEVRRVLVRGGRYVFNVWDSQKHNPFGRLVHEIICNFFAVEPPSFYQVPFGYHLIDPIKEALIDAGFTGLKVEVLRIVHEIRDVAGFARGLVYGNPMIDQIKERGGVDPDRVVGVIADTFHREFGANKNRMPLQAIVFEATAV